jgi:hypothetical protein
MRLILVLLTLVFAGAALVPAASASATPSSGTSDRR